MASEVLVHHVEATYSLSLPVGQFVMCCVGRTLIFLKMHMSYWHSQNMVFMHMYVLFVYY